MTIGDALNINFGVNWDAITKSQITKNIRGQNCTEKNNDQKSHNQVTTTTINYRC
jgi:hypothetical protein